MANTAPITPMDDEEMAFLIAFREKKAKASSSKPISPSTSQKSIATDHPLPENVEEPSKTPEEPTKKPRGTTTKRGILTSQRTRASPYASL